MRGPAIAIGSAALLAALLWYASRPANVPDASSSPASALASAVPVTRDDPERAPRAVPPGPPIDANATHLAALRLRWQSSSLRGTELDGAIAFDPRGGLVHDAALRHRFEHYLNLIGEFALEDLRILFHDDVLLAHGEAAAATALAAFDRYLGLRQALADGRPDPDLSARFERQQRLRYEWFGDEADALFGDEAEYDAYSLARRAIQQDASIDEASRARRLSELDAGQPARNLAEREVSLTGIDAEIQTRRFDRAAVEPQARHDARSATWGPEAADRLAALDRERAQWDQRVADYVRERERLQADAGLDPGERSRALERLRRQRFDDTERVRIESLEAIDALPRG